MPNNSQEVNATDEMRELVLTIARALVNDVDRVRVEGIAQGDAMALQLSVASLDLGKVIGKQGRIARSIRTILCAASMKSRQRFALDIVKEDGQPAER
jgi:predicted RNA-binding protein YlqC (UPF0109 family)